MPALDECEVCRGEPVSESVSMLWDIQKFQPHTFGCRGHVESGRASWPVSGPEARTDH